MQPIDGIEAIKIPTQIEEIYMKTNDSCLKLQMATSTPDGKHSKKKSHA